MLGKFKEYRIAGNFRGVQFSRMSGYPWKLDPWNKYDYMGMLARIHKN
jgi:hypothetical protein